MKIQQKTYRLILVVLTAMTLLFAALGLVACNAGKDDNVQYIVLNTDEVQKTFDVDDEFTYEGLVVTAHYGNGVAEEVTDYTVKSPDMSKAGAKEVIVKYGSVQSQYSVYVNGASASGETLAIGAPVVKYVYDEAAVEVVGATALDGNDLTFSAKALGGYSVAKITAKVDGKEVSVEGIDGEYTVSAEYLTGNTVVTIAAETEGVDEAAYKVNYYSKSGDLLATYGYNSEAEELYQPAEQQYYDFIGWLNADGEPVAIAEVGENNFYADNKLNEEAVAKAITVEVSKDTYTNATVYIPDTLVLEVAAQGDSLSAIGLVLSNVKEAKYTIPTSELSGLEAPKLQDGNNFDGSKVGGKDIGETEKTAFFYAYGWSYLHGTLTVAYDISNLSGLYFAPWIYIGGTAICGAEQPATEEPTLTSETVLYSTNTTVEYDGALFTVENSGSERQDSSSRNGGAIKFASSANVKITAKVDITLAFTIINNTSNRYLYVDGSKDSIYTRSTTNAGDELVAFLMDNTNSSYYILGTGSTITIKAQGGDTWVTAITAYVPGNEPSIPDDYKLTVTPDSITKTLEAGHETIELNVDNEGIVPTITNNGVAVEISDWEISYDLKGDGEYSGAGKTWTLGVGTYVLTVTAESELLGDEEPLTAEVTIVIASLDNMATEWTVTVKGGSPVVDEAGTGLVVGNTGDIGSKDYFNIGSSSTTVDLTFTKLSAGQKIVITATYVGASTSGSAGVIDSAHSNVNVDKGTTKVVGNGVEDTDTLEYTVTSDGEVVIKLSRSDKYTIRILKLEIAIDPESEGGEGGGETDPTPDNSITITLDTWTSDMATSGTTVIEQAPVKVTTMAAGSYKSKAFPADDTAYSANSHMQFTAKGVSFLKFEFAEGYTYTIKMVVGSSGSGVRNITINDITKSGKGSSDDGILCTWDNLVAGTYEAVSNDNVKIGTIVIIATPTADK